MMSGFRLNEISLSGFLHDSNNFKLAKLFHVIRCNSVLIMAEIDHFEILTSINHFSGDDMNSYT